MADEPDGATVVEAVADLIGAAARDQHDRRPRRAGGRDPLGHVVAAHVGQADVEQHHLGREPGDGQERIGAVGGLADDVELVELEQLARRRPEAGVVVDDHERAHQPIISPGSRRRLGENPEIKTEGRSDVPVASRA